MKKIYILTAVFALLTLSLNAQTKSMNPEDLAAPTEKVEIKPDGYFRMGPSRASSDPVTPPYSNGFESQDEWDWWEAIDVAGDVYWGDYGLWTLSSNTARYTYHSDNAADDWLVTAPITLKAGKTYKFYLDTWAYGYTERIEVKMASGHTASALSAGVTVIAAQDVTSTSSNPTHLSNESITVDADGDYYIGIHAISAADRFYLYVDNFVIDVDNTSGPTVEVSPESLTINDSGTNNTFDVEVRNINQGENVSVTQNNNDFSMALSSSTNSIANWDGVQGFNQNNGSVDGTVTVTYNGRALTATDEITVGTQGASKTVTVSYVPDLYIVTDNGVTGNWDFTNGTQMTNNDGIYTATFTATVDNTYILFARKLGNDVYWNTRYVFGPDSGGDWPWGTYTGGTIDVNDDDPIVLPAGTYTVTIDATNYSFTITKLVPDLAISLDAPVSIVGGNSATVTATVTNTGGLPVTGYTVTITADGNTISTQTVNTELAVGATATYTADYATTVAQVGNTVNFAANVACTGDADATNNNATASMDIINMPAPENVVATVNSDQVSATVTWDAPSGLPTYIDWVDEGFDDESKFVPFSLGGITADNHIGTIGGWGLYDGTNGATVYGSTEIDFPNESQPMAWIVFNRTGATGAEGYESSTAHNAHSDNQYMESIVPLSSSGYTSADHWLISPELSGNVQTISWYDSELTTKWGAEYYEVWISTTDSNRSSFTTKLEDYTTSISTWDQKELQLPAGTKYFAFRHTSSTDYFGLLIDDVRYEALITVEPESYNVYLDGELVGSVNANDPRTYDFSNVAVGDHECAVSAVYPGGIESEATPAEFTIMGKTDMPTINVVANADGSKTVTATGNGTIHLYVDGVEVSNPYTIMPSPDGDISVTVTATAQEEGKLISETAEQIVTVAEAGRTPMPVITYVEHNGYVEIIATGDGTITLEAGGQTAGGVGSASIIIVRSLEDQDITATATAKAEGLEESHPATEDILVEALSTTPTAQTKEGLLRLHLLIVDQMKQEIPADNSHPDVYGYVLKYEPNGPGGEGTRESGTVDVRIQKADCEVMGAYTLTEVDNDKNIGRRDEQGNIVHDQGIKMQVITADVAYDLSSTNDMLWEYILQGAENRLPNYNQDYLTRLQKTQNFTYVEMLDGAPDEGHEYPNGEHHYFSAYNPVTGVFNADNLETGAYATDYMTYAPSVSTWGVQRRYFEDDGLDNTYGAPYWKTAAGKVTMDDSELMAERQKNQWNSVNWTTDAGTASLYILDKVKAVGLLPHTGIATVQYEPYMFRIFVESPSGKLRPYKVVEAVEGSTTEGEHLEALVPDNQLTDAQKYGPISVWESYIKYDEDGNIIGADPENGVMITTGADNEYPTQTAYTFQKNKVQRDATPAPTEENPNPTKPIWDKDSNNAMFGALNAISPETGKISTDDLKVFVRFYYAVKGELADHTVVRYNAGNRGEGSRSGNGAESGGGSAGAATSVFEIAYHGEVVGQTYYNVQGMVSDEPFDGVNIVVTRYSDGSTSVAKIVR